MRLRVLGTNVTVKLYPRKEMDDGKYAGRAILMQNEIKLSTDMDKQHYKETLIHELLHFAVDKLVIGIDEDEIVRLTSFIYALINDNPDTFKFTPKLEE